MSSAISAYLGVSLIFCDLRSLGPICRDFSLPISAPSAFSFPTSLQGPIEAILEILDFLLRLRAYVLDLLLDLL